jgi:DNA-binding NarL/FixJ family response regulator
MRAIRTTSHGQDAVGRIALVVDDDPFFRIALGKILADRLGCVEIIEAASFDSAIERLAERPGVSVALFDLAMPGMSSPVNLRVIRETFPRTLVVMISASAHGAMSSRPCKRARMAMCRRPWASPESSRHF